VSDIVTSEGTEPLGEEWAVMTFPAYRARLGVLGSVNPETGGRPVARCATDDGRPVGLAIAEIAPGERAAAELLSLFVVADHRGQGVATKLIEGLEDDLRRYGASSLDAVYMTGKPAIPAVERIFQKRGFPPPEQRKIVVRFTPEEAATTEWYGKARLPPGAEVFSWADLTPGELEDLKRTHEETPWIDPDLEPWRMSDRFDPVSSVGMRKDGRVVGWVINHPIGPNLLCFTTSFMRRDLARRGAIFSLYVASLERLMGTGVTCTFVTSSQFASMVRFVLRRCAPYISYCGETRGVSKALASASAPDQTA
jgi:GNAT superfamily N-acetyltransferase